MRPCGSISPALPGQCVIRASSESTETYNLCGRVSLSPKVPSIVVPSAEGVGGEGADPRMPDQVHSDQGNQA